jgi:microcystin-dependent protein
VADSYLGEVRMVGFNFPPVGWALCDGRSLPIKGNERLYNLLGTTFGGGVDSFNLPDLRSRIPLAAGQGKGLTARPLGETAGSETVTLGATQLPAHTHALTVSRGDDFATSPQGTLPGQSKNIDLYRAAGNPTGPMNAAALSSAGQGQPHPNLQPYLVLNCIMSLEGDYPTDPNVDSAADPFLGEIRPMATGQAPRDWAQCAGQFVAVSQNTALFSLFATTFGGNGQTTFGLPDLRGRVPMDWGQGPGLTDRYIGEADGSEQVAILAEQMPPHTHAFSASVLPADKRTPDAANALARSGSGNAYQSDAAGLVGMDPGLLAPAGGGAAHTNVQPYFTLDYYVCLQGVFPERG